MHDTYETLDFEHNGKVYKVRIEQDDIGETPWQWADGHGPVSEWTTRDKKPGEWVLSSDRKFKRFYDFQAAMQTAKKESWGTKDDDGLTPSQKAEKAVMADFAYLKAWCNDDWGYAYVRLDNPYTRGDFEGMGGVEYWFYDSKKNDYIYKEVIPELIDQIEDEHAKELAEAGYWARQGVFTEAA